MRARATLVALGLIVVVAGVVLATRQGEQQQPQNKTPPPPARDQGSLPPPLPKEPPVSKPTTLRLRPAPFPGWSRLTLALDGAWQLKESATGSPRAVALPHLGSKGTPRVKAIYSTRFALDPAAGRAARARLRIEGAVYGGEVRLNGRLLGRLRFPYMPVELDATAALDWKGTNLLELELHSVWGGQRPAQLRTYPVSAEHPGRLAFSTSALAVAHLHGPVSLILSEDPSLQRVDVWPSWRRKEVSAEVALSARGQGVRRVALEAALYRNGEQVGAAVKQAVDLQSGTASARLTIPVKRPAPWGMPPHGTATFYTLVVTLRRGGKVIDQVGRRFGFREAWVEGGKLVLNGRELFLWAWREEVPSTVAVPLPQLLQAARRHCVNSWHLHHSAVDGDFFELSDELGRYLVPGLMCRGGWYYEMTGSGADGRRFPCAYLRRWMRSVGGHASVVVWGQEDMHKICPAGAAPAPRRPAIFMDLDGVTGALKALLKRPPPPRLAGAPRVIWELYETSDPTRVPNLLKRFPGLSGIIADFGPEKQPAGWSLEGMYTKRTGLGCPKHAAQVLPRLRVAAPGARQVFYQAHRSAPLHMRGAHAAESGEASVLPKQAGTAHLWTVVQGKPRRAAAEVRRVPMVSERPVRRYRLLGE